RAVGRLGWRAVRQRQGAGPEAQARPTAQGPATRARLRRVGTARPPVRLTDARRRPGAAPLRTGPAVAPPEIAAHGGPGGRGASPPPGRPVEPRPGRGEPHPPPPTGPGRAVRPGGGGRGLSRRGPHG